MSDDEPAQIRTRVEPNIYRRVDNGELEVGMVDATGRRRFVRIDGLTIEEARQVRDQMRDERDSEKAALAETRKIITVGADEIRARLLPMLWRDRIPAGSLCVVAGRPGLGKSTLLTTVAAELSRAGLVTLMSSLEDDPHTTIRPRLDVAGARLGNVHVIPAEYAPLLPRDLEQLGDIITTLSASLVVLDPMSAHFRPETRVHDRTALYRLLALARRTRCTILGVHHTTKTGDVGGPMGGLTGTSRATYMYGYDPDDEDRRALACDKINGVDKPPALILEHETVGYVGEQGEPLEAGLLRIVGESNAGSRSLHSKGRRLRSRDADCSEWLSVFLAAGEDCQRTVDEITDAGREIRYGWQTLLRAFTAMSLEKIRHDTYTVWRLPDDHPMRNPEPIETEDDE